MPTLPPRILAPLLLVGSNLFMTTAWYGHLKFKSQPLWIVVLLSWAITFFEYWLAVPANRIGFQSLASQYGVQVVDVRIKHADLPEGSPLQRTLEQMRTARQQQAATIRAQGNKVAQIIQANADAQAAQVYAQAFNKDPEFYDFYRAMQSYRATFLPGGDGNGPKGSTTLVLSPNNSYLKHFEGGGGR